jgi:sulfide:quinone oxidoreductase
LPLRLSRTGFRVTPDAATARRADHASMTDGGRRVLIVGGGVAALEAMVALRELAGELVEIELVSPDHDFFYRPLAVAEPFGLGDVLRFDLTSLVRGCGATHRLGTVVAVDAARHVAHTGLNAELGYDTLLIAIGARPREAVPGALTFRGEPDIPLISGLLDDLERGIVRRIVFALPGGASWPLPLYELALMTADRVSDAGLEGVELTLATPEDSPLNIVGREASDAVAGLLAERGIALRTRTYPDAFENRRLGLVPGPALEADVVISLPRLKGVPLAGIPQDDDFFIGVDPSCRVPELEDVYAAGDITTFPVKQGGLAAQQAEAAATAIAAEAGADVSPEPFDPVLRALLLSSSPLFLRTRLGGGHGDSSTVDEEALWWPAAKISSRYLSPYLAEHAGLAYGSRGGPPSLL